MVLPSIKQLFNSRGRIIHYFKYVKSATMRNVVCAFFHISKANNLLI